MRAFLPRFRRNPTHVRVVEQNESEARAISAALPPTFLVAVAGPGLQAPDVVSHAAPDLAGVNLHDPDVSRLDLVWRMRDTYAFQVVAWKVLAQHTIIAEKVASIQAGIKEALAKPLDLQALPMLPRKACQLDEKARKFAIS
jgi:DNA-binding NtrC family response regulator